LLFYVVFLTNFFCCFFCKLCFYNNDKQQGSGHSSVVGDTGLRFGVHKWAVRIDGASHWCGIGVCQLQNLTSDFSSDYNQMWGASSQNQPYKTTGPLTTWNTGDILYCTLDCDKGKFTLTNKSLTTNLKADNLPINQDLYPIINLYSSGNKVTIIDPEDLD